MDSNIRQQVLDLIPQQKPFRFVDDILELSESAILSTYRFKQDEFFYKGHFPGNPITPGVILIETMAQAAVVGLAITRFMKQGLSNETIKTINTLFVLADAIEFYEIVKPGDQVIVRGELVYFRKGTLKSNVSLELENGTLACQGQLTGTGVNHNA